MNTLFYKIGSSAPVKHTPPNPCTNLSLSVNGDNIGITWTDPEKLTEGDDGSVAVWNYSALVRKTTGYPVSPEDGIEVCRSSVRNQYQSEPYLDSIETKDTTYYYSVFAVSMDEVVSDACSADIYVSAYRIMTVIINEADSNPATCCSYADDAVDMASGKDAEEWAEFFGYKPCLFKNGSVVGYLNPNNYAQFEDGTPADITSGDAGDVMVEFPRRGVKISKSGDLVTVSMTDNPDDPDFTYYAHSRGESRRDYFYLGAYLGYNKNSTMCSISGYYPTDSTNLNTARSYAQNKGSGYELMTFYQWTFLQVMYLLQFKNLNSQSTLGWGYCASGGLMSGNLNTNGLFYGYIGLGSHQMKIFGLEALWGSYGQWVEGFAIDSSYNYLVATDGFNSSASGYTNLGKLFNVPSSGHDYGYLSKVSGTSESGFTPGSVNGSTTIYYSDLVYVETSSVLPKFPTVGGGGYYSGSELNNGIFCFYGRYLPSAWVSEYVTSRISYY